MIRGLVPALHRLGVEVHVATTMKGLGPQDSDLTGSSWVRAHATRGSHSLTYSRGLAEHVAATVTNYDIVHIHGLQSHVGSASMRAARKAGVPFVIEPHGALNAYHWNQHRLRKRVYSLIFDQRSWRRLSGAIYSSPSEAAQGQRVLRRARAYEMPLGVDDSLFTIERASLSADIAPVVAYIGRITRKKRLDLLLDALEEPILRDVDLRAIVAGASDGTLEIDLHRYATSSARGGRLSLVGSVSAAQRREILSKAAVFVLPSEDESFGVAVAEAMAAGAVVVTSDRVGIAPEAEHAGVLLLSELTPAAVASTILEALGRPEVGRAARSYALSHFTWDEAARAALSLYEEVVRDARWRTQ